MKLSILSVCLLAFLFTFSTQTFAVDFTVNVASDQPDPNPADGSCGDLSPAPGIQCSLRSAVEQANNLPSNDRILFNLPANSTITLSTFNGGEIPISNSGTLEIIGTGANNLTINGGAGTNRIFYINQATVLISGVTLTGGNGTGAGFAGNRGGAIFANAGSLTLDGVHVTGNTSLGGSPVIAGNNRAGGVYFGGGTHSILNSTFFSNQALDCAGFANDAALTVVNSTISGNTVSGGFGGGFCNTGNATLRNVTITNNTASAGGGIYINFGTLNLGNTIVAGNTATSGTGPEISFQSGTITSAGGNLVGDSPGDSINTVNPITYQLTDKQNVNPMLGALTNNGGITLTHALLVGSPAVDAGLNALAVNPFNGIALAFDQRGTGFLRIRDGNGNGTPTVDIGAFEVQLGTTAATVSVSGRVTARGRGISNAVVHLTSQSGEIQTVRTNRLGYYTFTELAAGETYIFNVFSKRYQFDPKVISLTEDLAELDFSTQ